MAVRFHLPSKVYSHRNAFAGVERGNIVGWRETVVEGLAGRPLEVGALMDRRSILMSTVGLFAIAIAAALAILAACCGGWCARGGRLSGRSVDRRSSLHTFSTRLVSVPSCPARPLALARRWDTTC